MVIAGCLNQARSICEKFDEVLYGPAPEELVEQTHKDVRNLLISQECRDFLSQVDKTDKVALAAGDNFVRKITEAVAPILPITLRNKSLDGAYFRTALHLVAAAEFIFAQYEADVRVKANPAGVVGMCNNMHAEIKKAAFYNVGLKPLEEFIMDMKTQYQTSLGLGSSFSRDASIQGRGLGRKARGRSYWKSSRYQGPSTAGGRSTHQPSGGYGRGSESANPDGRTLFEGAGNWRNSAVTSRAPGACFAFQAGTCTRGRMCRFSH